MSNRSFPWILPGLALLIGCGTEPLALCGNGTLDRGEECDDGNTDYGDGCTHRCFEQEGFSCVSQPGAPSACTARCGDLMVNGSEICDEAVQSGQTEPYCKADCSGYEGSCGDGILQPDHETCDIPPMPAGIGLGGAPGEATGCSAYCAPASSYLCDELTNTCQRTGVDRSELVLNRTAEACAYFIAMLGGSGTHLTCFGGIYEVNTLQRCLMDLPTFVSADCTIAELEDFMVGRDTCERMTFSC